MRNSFILGFFLLGILFNTGCSSHSEEFYSEQSLLVKKENPSPKDILHLLEDGDIILKMGKGNISRIIADQLKEPVPFSHCGIIVKEADSIYIIHSVAKEVSGSDGLQTISLQDFFNDSYYGSLWISRVKNGENKKDEISKRAKIYLEKKLPFDYDFDISDNSKIYCSELVYNVLLETYNEDFFLKKESTQTNFLTFNSLIDSTKFISFLID
jgi:hypothetical protein